MNTVLYFKKFQIHEVNVKNVLKVGMHINVVNTYNRETSSYLIGKKEHYSILNLNSLIINFNLALNFLYCSLLQGSRLVLTEQKESKKSIDKKRKKFIYKKSVIDKFKNFITSKLNRRKNNHVSFRSYEIRGLLTNFKNLKNQKTFKKGAYKSKRKLVKGLRFLPDVILVNSVDSKEWSYLLSELKNLKIPTILIKPLNYKWLNNVYYIPIAKNNYKLRTFYWIMFIKVILKSLLMRKVRFEIKSLKNKIGFKKEIFKDSISNWTSIKNQKKTENCYYQLVSNRKTKAVLQTKKRRSNSLINNKLKLFRLMVARNLYNVTTKYIKILKKKKKSIMNYKNNKNYKKTRKNPIKLYKNKKNYKYNKNNKRFSKQFNNKIEKLEDIYIKSGKLKYGDTVRLSLFKNLGKLNKSMKMREFISKHLLAGVFLGVPGNKKVKQILNKYSADN